jgi:hypothetical protein
MAVITGTIQEPNGSPTPRVPVRFQLIETTQIGSVTHPREWVELLTNTSGQIKTLAGADPTLIAGDYEVTVKGETFKITVPAGSGTYDITEIVTDGVSVPSTLASTFGFFRVSSISELRTIRTRAVNKLSLSVGLSTENDGGGGDFWWDSTGTAADDNYLTIRPSDYTSAGIWRRINDGVYFAKWFGANGGGAVSNTAALTAGFALVDSIRVSPGTYRISSNLTIAAGKHIVFERGAIISVDSGVTLTINGTLEAGAFQIFSGDGTVVVNKCEVLTPWFGAGGGVADDNTAFSKALASASIYSPEGFTYLIGGSVTVPSHRTVRAHPNAQFRRLAASVHQTVFRLQTATENVVIDGIKYDYNDAPQFHRLVDFNGGTCSGIKVKNCKIYDSVRPTTYPSGGDRWFVVPNGTVTDLHIEGNHIEGPIQLTASVRSVDGLHIRNNYIKGAKANAISVLNAGGTSPIVQNVWICDNHIDNPVGIGIAFGPDGGTAQPNTTYRNITISRNVINNLSSATATFGIYGRLCDLGYKLLSITDNKIYFTNGGTDNGRGIRLENDLVYGGVDFEGVTIAQNQIYGGAVGLELQNCVAPKISDNQFLLCHHGAATLADVDDSTWEGNLFRCNGTAFTHGCVGNITIRNNDFLRWGASASFFAAISLNPTLGSGTYTARIDENTFVDSTGSADFGIRRLNVSGVTHVTIVRDNTFDGVTTRFDENTSPAHSLTVYGNIPSSGGGLDNIGIDEVITAIIRNDAVTIGKINVTSVRGPLILSSNGNTYGQATLVGGTVTVTTASAAAGSYIILSRRTLGGTAGTLSYTINAGVSFTINSNSPSDTSVIDWVLITP